MINGIQLTLYCKIDKAVTIKLRY